MDTPARSSCITACVTLVFAASMAEVVQAEESLPERVQTGFELPAPQVTTERTRLQDSAAAPKDSTGRPLSDMTGVSYRWWSGSGRSHIGFGLGTVGFVTQRHDEAGGSLRGAVPTLTVGWRYRVSNEAAVYADATSARSLAAEASPGLYNTKVGMEWKPAKSRFGFENRSLGIQLQSGYRMSLRVKGGGLGVYFRGQF
jgi:hypothetical protein